MVDNIEDSGEFMAIDLERGKRLRKLMSDLGLPDAQNEAALKLGIEANRLSEALNGANITMKNLAKLNDRLEKAGASGRQIYCWQSGRDVPDKRDSPTNPLGLRRGDPKKRPPEKRKKLTP
jgi:hypothetical protein